MNRGCTGLAVMAFAIIAGTGQAAAVPPTVTPSPGYDARLQEQHKAQSLPSPNAAPSATPPACCHKRLRHH